MGRCLKAVGLLALGVALAGCGSEIAKTRCECVTFDQRTVEIELGDIGSVTDCFSVPDIVPDRQFERCSTINNTSVVAPIAALLEPPRVVADNEAYARRYAADRAVLSRQARISAFDGEGVADPSSAGSRRVP